MTQEIIHVMAEGLFLTPWMGLFPILSVPAFHRKMNR
jgi:hypothetical protein